MKRVQSKGAEIAYDVVGEGSAIVFVHGLCDDRGTWAPIVDALAATHRCISLDLRGHGGSTPCADYDPIAMADDVDAVVRDVGVERPLVVGHSLGAVIVTAYAAEHPVRGVVAVDQTLDFVGMASHLRPLRSVLVEGDYVAVLQGFLQTLGVAALAPERRDELLARRRRVPRELVLGVWRRLLHDDDDALAQVTRGFGGVDAPFLAIHGSDPGPSYADWLRAHVPGAQVEVWEGTGHYPQLVEPARFVERVRRMAGD